jgi:hypothetical protein
MLRLRPRLARIHMNCPVCRAEGARLRTTTGSDLTEVECFRCVAFWVSTDESQTGLDRLTYTQREILTWELRAAAQAQQPLELRHGAASRVIESGWRAASATFGHESDPGRSVP